MHFCDLPEMIARLVLAALLGGLIGYEREAHGRPAGLRTHILVCVGSTIFTIVSTSFTGARSDPARIASQIVSGIGFLGAGTIIRQGSMVRGLTTAASLWTIAAIGMAVGVNWNLAAFAVVASIVVYFTLGVLNKFEHAAISRRRHRELAVIMREGERHMADLLISFGERGIDVQSVKWEDPGQPGARLARLRLRFPPDMRAEAVSEILSAMPSITSFEWD